MNNNKTYNAEGDTPLYYSPLLDTQKSGRKLPHWQQEQTWCFVTWRLKDSLPAGKLNQLREEKEIWLKTHPQPWDAATRKEYLTRFSDKVEEWLGRGVGSCLLRDPENSRIVGNALQHFDGERYELASFVVMPNHVHVLFRPCEGHSISEILHSWKSFSARVINKRREATGAFWQSESWDKLVRSEEQFHRYKSYIRENPQKANLQDGFLFWERNGVEA